jgi:predicted nucleotide-binding protein
MIERFKGDEGKRRLITSLTEQRIIHGNESLAEKVAEKIQLRELDAGEVLISQNGEDTDLYLILSGGFSVTINHRQVATRSPGTHVGEMAMIDCTAKRSATVKATEKSVIGIVSETDFTKLAKEEPKLWRQLALELSDRLKERSKYIKEPNEKPMVFLGSSSEHLATVQKVHEGIKSDDIVVKLWTDGVFEASSTTIESLLEVVRNYDFGVIFFSSDDQVTSRGNSKYAPRDNVVFELGLLMGGIGRGRTYIVKPKGVDIKIPSDLLGVTCLEIDPDKPDSIKTICDYIRGKIISLGAK